MGRKDAGSSGMEEAARTQRSLPMGLAEAEAADATLFEENNAGRRVLPAVNGRFLTLYDPEGGVVAEWTLEGLARADPERPGGGTVFRHGKGPERLFLPDGLLVWQLREAVADKAAKRQRWSPSIVAGFLFGVLAILAMAALLATQLPAIAAPFVPLRIRQVWSSRIEAAAAAGRPHCTGRAGQMAMDGLAARLAGAAGLQTAPRVMAIDSPATGVFALPDGNIVVLRGSIEGARDPAAFASLLANAIAHARNNDPSREMLRRLMPFWLANGFGQGFDASARTGAVSYTRATEAEAAVTARAILQHAGLDAAPGGRPAMDAPAWAALRGLCGGIQ